MHASDHEVRRDIAAARVALFEQQHALAEQLARGARRQSVEAGLSEHLICAANCVLYAALRATGDSDALHEALASADAGVCAMRPSSEERFVYLIELGKTLMHLGDRDAIYAFELVCGARAPHFLVAQAKLELARLLGDQVSDDTIADLLEEAAALGHFEYAEHDQFTAGVVIYAWCIGVPTFSGRFTALVEHISTAVGAHEMPAEAALAFRGAIAELERGRLAAAEHGLRRCAALAGACEARARVLDLLASTLEAQGSTQQASGCHASFRERPAVPDIKPPVPAPHPRRKPAFDLFSQRLFLQAKRIEDAVFDREPRHALALVSEAWRMASRPAPLSLYARLRRLTTAAHREAGEPERALAVIEHALRLESTARLPDETAACELELARTLAALGHNREAEETLAKARTRTQSPALLARIELLRAHLSAVGSPLARSLLLEARRQLLAVTDTLHENPEHHPFVAGVSLLARKLGAEIAFPDAWLDTLVGEAIAETESVAQPVRRAIECLRDGQLDDAIPLLYDALAATEVSEDDDMLARMERVLAFTRPARVLLAAALFAAGRFEAADVCFGTTGR